MTWKLDWERAAERTKAAEEREHPDDGRSRANPVQAAMQRLRYRCTDVGVKLALDLAEAGEPVVYASDWSPGSANEDKLRAAGVELHAALRTKR